MEELFWGGGHLLQFVNLGLMLTGLYLLMAGWSGRAPMSPGRMMLVFAILLLALAAPSLYLFEDNRLYFSKLKFLAAVPAFFSWPSSEYRRWRSGPAGGSPTPRF